jgi:hypothetical protein
MPVNESISIDSSKRFVGQGESAWQERLRFHFFILRCMTRGYGFATYFVAASLRLADVLDFHGKPEVCRLNKMNCVAKPGILTVAAEPEHPAVYLFQ